MNLKQAIERARLESKPFRRAGWTHKDWIKIIRFGELHWESGERVTLYHMEDLGADDWMVKGDAPCALLPPDPWADVTTEGGGQ